MKTGSAAEAFTRGWTAIYTAGLPREARDRRRSEIASDLWEQRRANMGEGQVPPRALILRVVLGMPADLLWRSAELRRARRMELMDLKVDREMDWKMRLFSHTALIAAGAFLLGISWGGPQLLLITMPLGAVAIAAELGRLRRDKRAVGLSSSSDIPTKRRRRAIVVVACVALFGLGWVVEGLPSQAVHDQYWFLFVAPMMIAVMIGPVALVMLGWSCLPRRDEDKTRVP